jgi:hypothetical protein
MVMEHAEALERIEMAAVEPDGLDRLMAGDTVDAAAIAGHLAGCPACTAELARIRRTSTLARDVIRTSPDPALRERTLAYVRSAGIPRGAAAPAAAVAGGGIATGGAPAAEASGPPARVTSSEPASIDEGRERRRVERLRLAVLGLAAALVITVVGGGLAFRSASSHSDAELADATSEVAVLEETNRATLRVTAQPDAHRVALTSTGAAGPEGTLLYSPSSGELVAVASGLTPEGADQEYGCWVEVDGQRTRIGRMFWAGNLWTWAGPVTGLADIPAGATFGVSLGPVGGGTDATPVLTGSL